MSFARFGENSDVYVFENYEDQFECCGCVLVPELIRSETCATPALMVEHLRKHEAAGHLVPPDCLAAFERLAVGGER